MGYRIGHAVEHDYEPGDFQKDESERKSKQKPRIVEDMYKSTLVTGEHAPVMRHPIPHTGPKVKNQYGENRTIAGGKGKKK